MSKQVGLKQGDILLIPEGTVQEYSTFMGMMSAVMSENMEVKVGIVDYNHITVYAIDPSRQHILEQCHFDNLFGRAYSTVITLNTGKVVKDWSHFKVNEW